MTILQIRSRICLQTLRQACESGRIVTVPTTYKDPNGRYCQSYINILIKNVNPLGKKGCSFFKGETVPTNGEQTVLVDGSTRMFPKTTDNHDSYGYLAIYE